MKKNFTRREMFQTAGAVTAVAAVAALPALRTGSAARPGVSPNDQVTFGVIGTGDRATRLLTLAKNLDSGRCSALCDIYPPNLAAAVKLMGNAPKPYTDYRAVLADPAIDAVIIATPLYTHFPITRDALLAGKHVLCEKSLLFKPEEVHALRALHAERPRQVLQTGLQRRYSPFYQTAKQMIDKGLIGDVTHIRAQWHRNSSGRRPVSDPKLDRQINWRFYREYSGGLTAELASHQLDVADWFFGATPEFVCGIGGIDYYQDGRTTYDNIQLLYQYPKGRKLMYSAISTNGFLDLFNGERPQFGEEIMGTGGTLQITIGDAANSAVGPAIALWYREANAPKIEKAGKAQENWVAGATTAATGGKPKALPLLLPADQVGKGDSFLSKEAKYARQWLYAHNIRMPEEPRNPVEIEIDEFFGAIRRGSEPLANMEVGLNDSIGVILSNLAMDEGRRVQYSEIESMGR